MFNFKELNKTVFNWNVETENFPLISGVKAMENGITEFCIYGFFFTKNLNEEKQTVLITDRGVLISLAIRYTELFETIQKNNDAVESIKQNYCYGKITKFTSTKFKKDGCAFEFVSYDRNEYENLYKEYIVLRNGKFLDEKNNVNN